MFYCISKSFSSLLSKLRPVNYQLLKRPVYVLVLDLDSAVITLKPGHNMIFDKFKIRTVSWEVIASRTNVVHVDNRVIDFGRFAVTTNPK